jgi:hypothetical protein
VLCYLLTPTPPQHSPVALVLRSRLHLRLVLLILLLLILLQEPFLLVLILRLGAGRERELTCILGPAPPLVPPALGHITPHHHRHNIAALVAALHRINALETGT